MPRQPNQNKIFIVGFIFVLIVIIWALARPAVLKLSQKDNNSEEKINEEILKAPVITSRDLLDKTKNGDKIMLFDLRTSDDFEKGHLTRAANIKTEDLNAGKVDSLGAEKTSSIVVMNSGDDVLEAARKTNELVAAGYVNAKYLQGGIPAWQAQGYSLVSSGKSPFDESKIKTISVEKIADDFANGNNFVQFVDLRNAESFSTGHISGAINVPLAEIEKNHSTISSVEEVVVYGDDDEKSKNAAVTLFDLNFFNVYVLEGGLEAWKSAGGKIETGN